MSDEMVANEIAKHAMSPQHYGVLEEANAIGQGVDPSGVYLFFYLLIEDEVIKDCRFATNGSQDAITLASMLSEMILGDQLSGVHETLEALSDEVEHLYQEKLDRIETIKASGNKAKISLKEQDNAAMVLMALRAALQHYAQGSPHKFVSLTIEKRGGSKVIQGCVN